MPVFPGTRVSFPAPCLFFLEHACLLRTHACFSRNTRVFYGPMRVFPGTRMSFTGPCMFFEKHARSEEHTSELQSHSDLVCRLLLEKKKNNISAKQKESYQKQEKSEKNMTRHQINS